MAKAKEKLTVQKAFHVSLPAKHLIVQLMSDGSVHADGCSSAYAATHGARARDPNSFVVPWQDFVLDGGSAAFERQTKKK